MGDFGDLIREFSPSWFAVVMGTGVFATSTYLMGKYYKFPFFISISHFLVFLNFIMFFVILVPWCMRWLFYHKNALDDLKTPLSANFYVTFGIAMLSLAMNFSVVVINPALSLLFWGCGAIATIIIVFSVMFLVFIGTRANIEHINPSWFLGSTGLLLVPASGVYAITNNMLRGSSLFLFDFSFGSGFFLYISLLPIWIYRFILHQPLKTTRIAFLWINMGPIGATLTSLFSYYYFIPSLQGISIFFSILFFGFGAWWFIMSFLITFYYLAKLKIPYKTAWWSFTFPLGQYIIGTTYFNKIFRYGSIDYFVMYLYFTLFFMWIINFILMLLDLVKGTIIVAQKIE